MLKENKKQIKFEKIKIASNFELMFLYFLNPEDDDIQTHPEDEISAKSEKNGDYFC